MRKNVKERIQELSIEKSISYYQLAYRADLPISTVNNVISGKTGNPTLQTLRGICRGLGITMQEFFEEVE